MEVNDDAVALKGGRGARADTAPENGSNERVITEDCIENFKGSNVQITVKEEK